MLALWHQKTGLCPKVLLQTGQINQTGQNFTQALDFVHLLSFIGTAAEVTTLSPVGVRRQTQDHLGKQNSLPRPVAYRNYHRRAPVIDDHGDSSRGELVTVQNSNTVVYGHIHGCLLTCQLLLLTQEDP